MGLQRCRLGRRRSPKERSRRSSRPCAGLFDKIPVVMVRGGDPLTFHGVPEYDIVGRYRGRAMILVHGKVTGYRFRPTWRSCLRAGWTRRTVGLKNAFLHVVEVGRPSSIRHGSTGLVLQTFAAGAIHTPRDAFTKLPMTLVGGGPLELSSISGPVFGSAGELMGAV